MAVYCPRCHTANREGSRYCNSCGVSLAAPAETKCPNCQATVLTYSTFCHRCGARLPEPAVPSVAAPPPITESDAEGKEGPEEEEVISLDQVPATPPLPSAEAATESAAASAALVEQSAEPAAQAQDASETATSEAAPVSEEMAARSPEIPESPSTEPRPVAVKQEQAPRFTRPLLRVRPSPAQAPVPQIRPRPAARDPWPLLAYVILAVAVVGGLFLPTGALGTAAPAAPEVQNLYEAVEALPAESTVLLSFDYDPATADEMNPLAQAVVYHLMQHRARLLVMSLLPQGPALAQNIVQPLAEKNVYVYGVDYVNVGYVPGDAAALSSLAADLPGALGADYVQGRPLADYTLARNITDLAAAGLIVEISGDDTGVRRWIEQIQSRTQARVGAVTTALAMPMAFAYLQSGQLVGLAAGLPAAAQYEALLNYEGKATSGLNSQTLGQIAILLFIVVSNVAMLFRRK